MRCAGRLCPRSLQFRQLLMPPSNSIATLGCLAVLSCWQDGCVIAADEVARPAVIKIDPPGRLGIMLHPLAPAERRAFGVAESGVVVTGVFPGTAAQAAGFQAGDVIEEVEGKPVQNSAHITEALRGRFAGDEVVVVRSRRGQPSRITLRLSPVPENANVELFKLAQAGHSWAQLRIAGLYRAGKGTKQDASKARFWYQKAAEAGVAEAQRILAEMFDLGEGGEANPELARQWYGKAAQQEHADAQQRLAKMFWLGRGGAKDDVAAVRWWTAGAQQGHAESQFCLAGMFLDGTGVAKDNQAAFALYLKAAEAGHHKAMASLGNLYARGAGTQKDFTSAIRWLQPAAEAGVIAAQHDLGALYYYGQGVPRDHALAARWLNAAAQSGYVASQAVLGTLYWGTDPPDYAQSLHWLNKAAEQGNAQALNGLGQMYRNGWGVPKDEKKAFDYQLRAAQAGDPNSRYNIGIYYTDGAVVKANFAEAIKWLRPAVDVPETRTKAQFVLGTIYKIGDKHVAKNLDEAFKWFELAARGGHVEAQRLYGQMLRDRKRYSESITWLRAAAEKNDRAAQNDLGTAYIMGWGVPKSRQDGIAWLLRAYRQGSPTAKESLRKLGVDAK